ncbi:MAG: alpha/beta fold hydrolase [Actinomycetota bacterium]
MSYQFESDGLQLVGRLARPERIPAGGVPGLVICHGFPTRSNGVADPGRSYYDLAERMAEEQGWMSLAFTYRGCGESEGDFSLGGWLSDVIHAVEHLHSRDDVSAVWVAGFGTGGALAIAAAARTDLVKGVAAVSPPADFNDWINEPEGLLEYARKVGAISNPEFPDDVEAWTAELSEISANNAASKIDELPLLVMHGAEDDVVSVFDARVIADAHGAADLRIIAGGGHRLRFDPRAVAVFLGWLDRRRTNAAI